MLMTVWVQVQFIRSNQTYWYKTNKYTESKTIKIVRGAYIHAGRKKKGGGRIEIIHV